MLGLGNTLSGGIVPAAVVSFDNTYSLVFDGSDDYVNLDVVSGTLDGDIGSLSLWVKLDSVSSAVYAFQAEVDLNNQIKIHYDNHTEQVRMHHKGGGSTTSVNSSATAIENNGWHNLTFTWTSSGNVIVAYVDGSSIGTTGCNAFSGTIDTVRVGTGFSFTAGLYWTGNIDEVAIFDDVLTSGEVSTIYNSGAPTDISSHGGLVGYWRMEENTGTSVADSSSNSNTATLVNGTAFEADTP